MKKINFFLTFTLLSFLIHSARFVTFAADSISTVNNEMPQEVKECYELLNKWKDKSIDEFKMDLVKMNERELKHAASLIYKAIEYDAIHFRKYLYFDENEKKWFDKNEKSEQTTLKAVPPVVYTELLKEIKNIIPLQNYNLLEPYSYLIVKIVSVQEVKELDPEYPFQGSIFQGHPVYVYFYRYDVDCIVETSIKGGFYTGDSIKFWYCHPWGADSSHFKIGGIYFVKLQFDERECSIPFPSSNKSKGLSLIKEFSIQKGILQDENNLFLYGKNIELDKFLSLIKSDIDEIRRW